MNAARYTLLALAFFAGVNLAEHACAGPFLAFSMREAERQLISLHPVPGELRNLGSITRLAGMVYDPAARDLILVGQVIPEDQAITLDDLVVAMRSVLVRNEYPYVSIDRTEGTDKTGNQIVHFKGGIEDTQFGLDLLEADIVLKRLSLGTLPSDVWGLESYLVMSVDHLRRQGGEVEDRVGSRFWFYPRTASLAKRQGVFAIREAVLGVETRIQYAIIDGKRVSDLINTRDEIGDAFSQQVENALTDLSVAYPAIRRLKTLLDLVALATGMRDIQAHADLEYWLTAYRIRPIETRRDFNLIRTTRQVQCGDGKTRELTLSGGISLNPIVLRLRAGDVEALRDAVLQSRPAGGALTWPVPLEDWNIPGWPEAGIDWRTCARTGTGPGCSLDRRVRRVGSGSAVNGDLPRESFHCPSLSMPTVRAHRSLLPQTRALDVGGVMLQGVARVTGDDADGARVDLTDGHFSLIVKGRNARLEPRTYRKFITALWAVYFTDQDPGISIDPIGPGIEEHLVRYIGGVINTDLGRVMREADYLMKKWAVGTDSPDIPGFRDVDQLTAEYGLRYLGASRRFWFIPEEMRFTQAGGALLFDRGRMALRTEYVFRNKSAGAEPADEAFARFFTGHYPEIAREHPVYQELFDYAKVVSLVKCLKQSGVPLFWFLMANKDLVLTEDSPGTVDALVRGSEHFDGVYIEGGVDLGFEGEYAYDQRAAQAIGEALARFPSWAHPETTPGPARHPVRAVPATFSFDLQQQSYTVVPQHSLTCGKDRRGIRYQTDVALTCNGRPGLELVRYYNPIRPGGDEFGEGWHLLIPYRLKSAGATTREFLNAVIPETMTVENLLTGEQEILAFSTERYSIAGYVPERVEASQVIGLFIGSDASYRLADKLGNEFWFDPAGYLTDMIFSRQHHVHLEYQDGFTDAFDEPPYRVEPANDERVGFLNVRVPEGMRVIDLTGGHSEVMRFSHKEGIAGYVPEDRASSRFRILAFTSVGSFRLLDKQGNKIAFDAAGAFDGFAPSPRRRMVRSVTLDKQRVAFSYSVDRSGGLRIAQARISTGGNDDGPILVIGYEFDDEGRLCRVNRQPLPPALTRTGNVVVTAAPRSSSCSLAEAGGGG